MPRTLTRNGEDPIDPRDGVPLHRLLASEIRRRERIWGHLDRSRRLWNPRPEDDDR